MLLLIALFESHSSWYLFLREKFFVIVTFNKLYLNAVIRLKPLLRSKLLSNIVFFFLKRNVTWRLVSFITVVAYYVIPILTSVHLLAKFFNIIFASIVNQSSTEKLFHTLSLHVSFLCHSLLWHFTMVKHSWLFVILCAMIEKVFIKQWIRLIRSLAQDFFKGNKRAELTARQVRFPHIGIKIGQRAATISSTLLNMIWAPHDYFTAHLMLLS